MFDLYHVLVPVFSIITMLNLIALKLALRDNVTLSKIFKKKQANQILQQYSTEENQSKAMMRFLLVNYTPMEFFSVRRAKYKIGFLFALSIVTIASYFIQSPYATALLGTVVFLIYFAVGVVVNKAASQENQQRPNIIRQQYINIAFCVISLVVNMIVIGIVFKNYQNSILTTFMTNVCINTVLDNFLIRPIAMVLIGIPLSRSATFAAFKKEWEKNMKLLELYDEKGLKQMLLIHEKRDSPVKNVTKFQLNLEIEPIPFQQEVQQKVEEQVINNAIDILKKLKKQKIQPPLNLNLDKNVQYQVSLDSLFNDNKKEQYQEPVQKNLQEPFQKHQFQQIPQDIQDVHTDENKDIFNQNLIVINPSRHEQIENYQQIDTEQIIKENITEQENISSQNQETQRNNQSHMRHQEQNGIVKISLQSPIQPSSRQQPLRIFLNNDLNLQQEQNQQYEQDIQRDTLRRKRDFMTIDQNENRNPYGVLEIKEQNQQQSQEIEEIDLNSPERRRRQVVHLQLENIQQESKYQVVKRKKKRLSHDHGRHSKVIKFSTGQPYLQYLPHMLEKESKGKKSQSINKKDVIMDYRATNTAKKTKKCLVGQQNNENMVQVFRIQDL